MLFAIIFHLSVVTHKEHTFVKNPDDVDKAMDGKLRREFRENIVLVQYPWLLKPAALKFL